MYEFFGGLPDLLSEEDIRLRPMHEIAEPCLGDKQKLTLTEWQFYHSLCIDVFKAYKSSF